MCLSTIIKRYPLLSVLHLTCLSFSLFSLPFLSTVYATPPVKPPATKISGVTSTTGGQIDLCMACHYDDPGKPHAREVFGCYVCHLGNPLSGDMDAAHKGMVSNPGELEYAEKTCGQSGCHTEQTAKVKNALMATNRGIISTLRFYWGETGDHNEDITVHDLISNGTHSPAIDYYRKLCGTCHLWMHKGAFPGFLAEKGGGCSACHTPDTGGNYKAKAHPAVTRNIPLNNCVRCHNRSGRIGLSYQGKYESEGYGTPFNEGEFSDLSLHDGRFFQEIQGDVHYKGGMVCVDCHTQNEVMGDGVSHAHIEEQLEISCELCHGDRAQLAYMAEFAANSTSLTMKQVDKKAYPLITGLEKKDGNIVLKGKIDNKLHPLKEMKKKTCRNRLHARLACQACHSPQVPQCYGCHVRADAGKMQMDKLSMEETPGLWQEFKSWMRYESPVLGVADTHRDRNGRKHGSEIVIIVPG